jgi:hypothetical protein
MKARIFLADQFSGAGAVAEALGVRDIIALGALCMVAAGLFVLALVSTTPAPRQARAPSDTVTGTGLAVAAPA